MSLLVDGCSFSFVVLTALSLGNYFVVDELIPFKLIL